MSAQKKKIVIRGPILTRSGYGEQTRFAYRSLKSRPDLFEVYLIPTGWGNTSWITDDTEERKDIDNAIATTTSHVQSCQQNRVNPFDASIQVTIPQEWERICPKNIGYTAGTETTAISFKWVESCSNIDKIIAVSEHTKEGFINTVYEGHDPNGRAVQARCAVPVDVVSFPAKPVEPEQLDFDPETKFNFLVVAQWSDRKNMSSTIEGFLKQFNDNPDVGLIIKTNLAKNCLLDRQACFGRLKNALKNYDAAPEGGKPRQCKIYLLHGGITDEQMHGLYRHPKVKVLINLAHGEGFGLPMFEAAQAGLPILAPNWGGQKDYMNVRISTNRKTARKKNKKTHSRLKFLGTSVDYDVNKIQESAVWKDILIPESSWCYPIQKRYRAALKNVHTNYSRATDEAETLKEHIETNFSEEKQQNEFVKSVLDTLESNSSQPTSIMSL
jgi:glycosyltransferase involved in cell wall biosynthesis